LVAVQCGPDATPGDVCAALSCALIDACEQFGLDPVDALERLCSLERARRAGKLEPVDMPREPVTFPSSGGQA